MRSKTMMKNWNQNRKILNLIFRRSNYYKHPFHNMKENSHCWPWRLKELIYESLMNRINQSNSLNHSSQLKKNLSKPKIWTKNWLKRSNSSKRPRSRINPNRNIDNRGYRENSSRNLNLKIISSPSCRRKTR